MNNPYKFSLTFPTYRGEIITRKFKKTDSGYVSDYAMYFSLTEKEFEEAKKKEAAYLHQ